MAKINKLQNDFLTKAVKKHGNKYDYSEVAYVNNKTKVAISCEVHGRYLQQPSKHLQGCGCPKCGRAAKGFGSRMSTKEFIHKAALVHGDTYKYDNVEYLTIRTPITIGCAVHGNFEQTPGTHLKGHGCTACGAIRSAKLTGWSDSQWRACGEASKNFKGFSLYIAKIWDGNECFYKIGKTFVGTAARFIEISRYYSYMIIRTVEGDASTISKLERKYQKSNEGYTYIPDVTFGGHTECFSKLEINGVIYE